MPPLRSLLPNFSLPLRICTPEDRPGHSRAQSKVFEWGLREADRRLSVREPPRCSRFCFAFARLHGASGASIGREGFAVDHDRRVSAAPVLSLLTWRWSEATLSSNFCKESFRCGLVLSTSPVLRRKRPIAKFELVLLQAWERRSRSGKIKDTSSRAVWSDLCTCRGLLRLTFSFSLYPSPVSPFLLVVNHLSLSFSLVCHVCVSLGSRGGRQVPPIHGCTPTAPLSFFFYLSFPLVLGTINLFSLSACLLHFSLAVPGTA